MVVDLRLSLAAAKSKALFRALQSVIIMPGFRSLVSARSRHFSMQVGTELATCKDSAPTLDAPITCTELFSNREAFITLTLQGLLTYIDVDPQLLVLR